MANKTNITIAEARELVANQLLWSHVRNFLCDFVPQIHGSWMQDLGRETLDDRRDDETATSQISHLLSSPRVKRFVLDSLGVKPCFHNFPAEDGSRILLLDGETISSIAMWLGALAFSDRFRRVTRGADVRALKAALPGIYPEVFGYTAYFKDLVEGEVPELRGDGGFAEVADYGYGLLIAALAKLPADLLSRARFKLPKDVRIAESKREIKLSVILKLLKLKFPEAYKLCC